MRDQIEQLRLPRGERMSGLRERAPRGMRGIDAIQSSEVIETLSIADEIARLEVLDADELRLRWRGITGRTAPLAVPKFLLVRALAYRLQADAKGDLDLETKRLLDGVADEQASKSRLPRSRAGAFGAASLSSIGMPDPRAGRLQPGSVLVREHGGAAHHVMVLADGFAWNGQTFASLSSVALAITGTTWNGRRFFGIDVRASRKAPETPVEGPRGQRATSFPTSKMLKASNGTRSAGVSR